MQQLRASVVRAAPGGERAQANLRAFRARQALRGAVRRDASAREHRALAAELVDDLVGERRAFDAERALLLLLALHGAEPVQQLVRARLPELLGAAERIIAASAHGDGASHALLGLCTKALQAVGPADSDGSSHDDEAGADAADVAALHAACGRALPRLATVCARQRCFARAAFGGFLAAYGSLPERSLEASAAVVEAAGAWARARECSADADEGDGPAMSARHVGDRCCLLAAARAVARACAALRSAAAGGGDAEGSAAAAARGILRQARALALEHARAARVHGAAAAAELEAQAAERADGALELCFGDDAALLDVLRSALPIGAALPALAELAGAPPAEARALAAALCPFRLFARTAALLGSDPAVLADWLAAPETGARCAAYLVAFCRAASAAASAPRAASAGAGAPPAERGARANGGSVARFLSRAVAEIERRDAAGRIGYGVAPLIRRMRHAAALDWPLLLSNDINHPRGE